MSEAIWRLERGTGPLVAVAVHDGHEVRPEVEERLALDAATRLREEDPYTGGWTSVGDSRVVALHSRFEVDLNRPREKAVYREPEDAWGLDVWKEPPPEELVERSLAAYDAFYATMDDLLTEVAERHGSFVVYDIHSYNHRRGGADAPPEDPGDNPEVNVGTGGLDRGLWGPVVERFVAELRAFDFGGRRLDVRENVRFQGGHFPRWVDRRFAGRGCALAIEWKKFFMDEWTGEPDPRQIELVRRALVATVPGVLEELERLSVHRAGLRTAQA